MLVPQLVAKGEYMSVEIPKAPDAAQAHEELAQLAEFRDKFANQAQRSDMRLRRIAYVGICLLLAGNVALGLLLASGAVTIAPPADTSTETSQVGG